MSTPRRIDLTGQRVGRVTVLGYDHTDKERNRRYWRCRCDCGTEFVTEYCCLRFGKTRSCGCLRRENSARRAPLAYLANAYPTRVEGLGDFQSASAAGRAIGVRPSVILAHLENGTPCRGYNVTKL